MVTYGNFTQTDKRNNYNLSDYLIKKNRESTVIGIKIVLHFGMC